MHYKCFFNILGNKTLKHVKKKNTLYEETEQTYKKIPVSSVFYIVMYQNAKMNAKHSIWGNERR